MKTSDKIIQALKIRRESLVNSMDGENGMYKYTIQIALIELDAVIEFIKNIES